MKFNQAQLNHLSTMRFINKVDDELKIVTAVRLPTDETALTDQLLLKLELFYDGEKIHSLHIRIYPLIYKTVYSLINLGIILTPINIDNIAFRDNTPSERV